MKLSPRLALAAGLFVGLGIQLAMAQPVDPNNPRFRNVRVTGALTANFVDAGVVKATRHDYVTGGAQNCQLSGTTILCSNGAIPLGQAFNFDGVTGGIRTYATDSNTLIWENEMTQFMGTSSTDSSHLASAASVISTAVGNVGASGPDTLITYSLPANALTTTNRAVRITAWGTCANTANAKTFTLNFGSQVILTHACTVSVAGTWKIESMVIRTGASTQDWSSTYYGSTGAAGAFEFDPELGTATQTETGAIVIRMRSTVSTTDNDIVQEGMIVEYF